MKQQKRISEYSLREPVGAGRFGTVHRAVHLSSQRPYAIKIIPKKICRGNKMILRQLKREVEILKGPRHPNLMRLHESFESQRNYYLVLDLCEKGDLAALMRRKGIAHFSERESLAVMRQALAGFRELRRRRVMHRDLKLENVFVRGGCVVLGDFGAAKVVKDMTSTTVGTPLNMAPEVMAGGDYDSKSDLWSLGVFFYQLLLGKPPFFAFSLGELLQIVRRKAGQRLDLRGAEHFCQETQALLKLLLEPEPSKRISWEEVFAHRLFKEEHCKTCPSCLKEGETSFLNLKEETECKSALGSLKVGLTRRFRRKVLRCGKAQQKGPASRYEALVRVFRAVYRQVDELRLARAPRLSIPKRAQDSETGRLGKKKQGRWETQPRVADLGYGNNLQVSEVSARFPQ